MVRPICQTVWRTHFILHHFILQHFILQHLETSLKVQKWHLSHQCPACSRGAPDCPSSMLQTVQAASALLHCMQTLMCLPAAVLGGQPKRAGAAGALGQQEACQGAGADQPGPHRPGAVPAGSPQHQRRAPHRRHAAHSRANAWVSQPAVSCTHTGPLHACSVVEH